MSRRALLATLFLSGCGGTTPPEGASIPVAALRPEDLVRLSVFSEVRAIAAGLDRVCVAYPAAIGIYRPLQHRWDGVPRSPRDPGIERALGTVIAGAVDPLDQSCWLATQNGWIRYSPDVDRWDSGSLGTRVLGVAFETNAGTGAWIRTVSGWMLQPRAGGVAIAGIPPVGLREPKNVADAYAALPQLRAVTPIVTLGPGQSQGQVTAAAPNPMGSGWFIGTSNRGLFYFDQIAITPEEIPLGIPGRFVWALAAVGDGVWVGSTLDAGVRPAITLLPSDLQTATNLPGTPTLGFPFRAIAAIRPIGEDLWIATESGLFRGGVGRTTLDRFTTGNGLPDGRVTALTNVRDHIVAGTMAGLAEYEASGRLSRRSPGFQGQVFSLGSNGDTVWVGTATGLFASLPTEDDVRMPEGYLQLAGQRGPVIGIGYLADTLIVMTTERVIWRDPVSGAWTPGPVLSGELGLLSAFTVDASGIWVGGYRGASFIRPRSGAIQPLLSPTTLPGPVLSLAHRGEFLWAGTSAGLVRVRLQVR